MYRIAIVEDQERDARKVMAALDQYAEVKKISLQHTWISNAAEFLENYHGQYNIVFFDIRMPGLDGMSAARELRSMDRSVVLVFLTSLAQYAVQGYEVEAIDYIIKPITYPILALKLPRILNRCFIEEDEVIIQSKGASIKVRPGDIQYIEICEHDIQFQTSGGIVRSYGTLKDVEASLPDGFFRINNQTIVNLRYVKHADNTSATVAGRVFPISRSRRKEFMTAMHGAVTKTRSAELTNTGKINR